MILTDGERYAEITIRTWNDDAQWYSPDWSLDFYDAGGLKHYEIDHDGHGDFAYMVDDIDYCIEQAMDMVNGIGDYDTPSPDEDVDVTWLDNVEVLKEADY